MRKIRKEMNFIMEKVEVNSIALLLSILIYPIMLIWEKGSYSINSEDNQYSSSHSFQIEEVPLLFYFYYSSLLFFLLLTFIFFLKKIYFILLLFFFDLFIQLVI